jgi:hypothetical protein
VAEARRVRPCVACRKTPRSCSTPIGCNGRPILSGRCGASKLFGSERPSFLADPRVTLSRVIGRATPEAFRRRAARYSQATQAESLTAPTSPSIGVPCAPATRPSARSLGWSAKRNLSSTKSSKRCCPPTTDLGRGASRLGRESCCRAARRPGVGSRFVLSCAAEGRTMESDKSSFLIRVGDERRAGAGGGDGAPRWRR